MSHTSSIHIISHMGHFIYKMNINVKWDAVLQLNGVFLEGQAKIISGYGSIWRIG